LICILVSQNAPLTRTDGKGKKFPDLKEAYLEKRGEGKFAKRVSSWILLAFELKLADKK
jgi:hypothetical protein